MGITVIGFIVFGLICLITLIVGIWAGRKVKTSDDYWVGGRNLGKLVITSSQAATFIGGGMTVGWIGMGYKLGYGAFWYGIPQSLGIFVAAYFLVKSFRQGNYTSLPDYFDSIYKNETVNLVMTITALIAPVTWVAGQFSAAGRMMQGILGINFELAVIIAGCIVILYSVFGGFMSVVYTDTLQFMILFVLFMITAPMPIIHVGGLGNIINSVPDWMLQPFTIHGMASITIGIWIFMGLTEYLGLQTLYQRIYAADSENTARFSLKVTAWLTVLWGVLTPIVGMAIYAINPDLNPDVSFSWFLANKAPQILSMAFLACVVMATMSTADSMLNSVALNISYDIYQKHINKNASEKQALFVGRIVTLIFGVISLFWAMQGGLIQAFFGYAASVSSGPLVAAILFTVFAEKKRTANGIIYGVSAGVIVGIISLFTPVIKDILAGGVMFSFLTTIIVALLFGSMSKKDVEKNSDGETSSVSNSADDIKRPPLSRMILQGFAPFNWNGRY